MTVFFRVILILFLLSTDYLFAQRFTAYYDKIVDNYDVTGMVEDKLFGRYADLFVEVLDKGVIEFTRKTSYLPVWKTDDSDFVFEEIIPRTGDGRAERPDIISKYSHVRLIKNTPSEIHVHWRYFPDFNNVEWDGVVNEYFIIKSNGKVFRSIKKGTKKYSEWIDSKNTITRVYHLSASGIESLSEEISTTEYNYDFQPIDSPVFDNTTSETKLQFSFDEGINGYSEKTREFVRNKGYAIKGPHVYWKKGVSGSALHFDGYYSGIETDNHLLIHDTKSFTIEGWVALAAYPFDWAPVLQQSEWGKKGFYFGIDKDGYPGFHLAVAGEWISIVDSNKIGLFEWTHLAVVYSKDAKTLEFYRNGKGVVASKIKEGPFSPSHSVLTIGLNRQKMPPIEGRIRRGKWPSLFGIDGLLDEINIYSNALTFSQIHETFINVAARLTEPDMEKRKLPEMPAEIKSDTFGAHYATLKYYETWDNLWRINDYADVLVSFDELPVNIVSWRGISYGHYFVTENGKWIGDQSNEDYRHIRHPGEAEGCLEHMSDKQCRHSHVRIIENTDARVVIHWRYGLVDSRYKFAPGVDGWGGWTDEYWTIYPDGVAVRHVPRGIVFGDGWVEIMFLSAPGTKPEDNMHLQAFSVINTRGEIENLSWKDGSPESGLDDPLITMVNSKSEYKMFNVFPTGSSIEIFGGHSRRSHFHWWNHWPVSQITSDGRGARAADRLAHSSLSWGAPSTNYLMYGMTNKSLNDLLPLASSWNNPPGINKLTGAKGAQYIPEERSYHMMAKGKTISFEIPARPGQPLVNPSFVIDNWKSGLPQLKINKKVILAAKDFRRGLVDVANGKKLVVWLKGTFTDNTHFLFD